MLVLLMRDDGVPKGIRLIRLLYLAAGLLLIIWALLLTGQMRQAGNELLNNHARLLARALTSYASQDARHYLASQDIPALQRLVDTLAADDSLRDASLYDAQGRQLASSAQAIPLPQLLATAPGQLETPTLGQGRMPFVQELRSDQGALLGYLRITLERRKMLAAHAEYQQLLFERMQRLLLIMLAAGILLCKGVPRRRWPTPRRYGAPPPDQTAA